jgi:hypothetical protein
MQALSQYVNALVHSKLDTDPTRRQGSMQASSMGLQRESHSVTLVLACELHEDIEKKSTEQLSITHTTHYHPHLLPDLCDLLG